MPINYNPGVVDNSGQILGIGITDAIKTYQKKQEEAAQLQAQVAGSDVVMQHARQSQMISPADYNAYITGDAKAKLAIAQGIKENIANNYIAQSNSFRQQQAQGQDMLRRAQTANTVARTNQIINPPPQQPIGVQQIQVPGGTPVNVIGGQGMRPQVLPSPTDTAGNRLELSAQELADYKRTGKIPLRSSPKSFIPADDPALSVRGKGGKADSMEQYSKDFKAMADVTPGEWASGKVVSQTPNMITVDIDGTNHTLSTAAHQQFQERFNSLTGTTSAPAKSGGGREFGPATGGYVPGKKYEGGLIYLGGDPKDRNNWSK